jgi:hypothetical protein
MCRRLWTQASVEAEGVTAIGEQMGKSRLLAHERPPPRAYHD